MLCRMVCGLVASWTLLQGTGAAAEGVEPPVDQSAQRQRDAEQPNVTRPRLTPDLIKKYDRNGDGQLDQAERAAARAEVAAARRNRNQPAGRPGPAPDAAAGPQATLGQKPLSEMSAEEKVRGQEGGLYGGGRNEPPEEHRRAAEKTLSDIVPRDAQGNPAPEGRIVLLSIGMSNTTREFSAFKTAADADSAKSPAVVIVDGAQGGRGAEEWTGPKADGVWARVNQRLTEAGVTSKQVQAVWLKQAVHYPLADSQANAQALRGYLTTIVQRAHQKFPNLRIVYLSSRIFGGYSSRHGEPESFDTAFAVRWLIQDQISGQAELNYNPARGPVQAPLLLWGPYLWADGNAPRSGDGLVWLRADFVTDGTHPSPLGQKKVVDQLLKFFKSEPLAAWFHK